MADSGAASRRAIATSGWVLHFRTHTACAFLLQDQARAVVRPCGDEDELNNKPAHTTPPDAGWVLASVAIYMGKNADLASSR